MQERYYRTLFKRQLCQETAIYPLDDVDIIFIIDPAFWVNPIANVASYLLFSSGAFPSAKWVLSSFANAVRYRYADSSVGADSVVPSDSNFIISTLTSSRQSRIKPLRIRSGFRNSTTGQWILSSPKQHSENATAVNKKHDGRFKPLVEATSNDGIIIYRVRPPSNLLPSRRLPSGYSVKTIYRPCRKGYISFLISLRISPETRRISTGRTNTACH